MGDQIVKQGLARMYIMSDMFLSVGFAKLLRTVASKLSADPGYIRLAGVEVVLHWIYCMSKLNHEWCH
jgi:hypothetical protein